jgi:predicted MFS family arabinose efflux permease
MTGPEDLDLRHSRHPRPERLIVSLVGAVQFVNILDFMMVMPLGPDFAAALGISPAHLGLVAGTYTAAAAVAGLVSARFLDRFDRRSALAIAMLGLVCGTAAGAAARGLGSLVAARAVAGAFGGPAASVALSIIADAVPPARRGRAMGAVMGSFSVASVLGVPAGLWLSHHGGWRVPFLGVAGLGLVIVVLAWRAMPNFRDHLAARRPPVRLGPLLGDGAVRWALLANATVMLAAFMVIPNIAAHLQQNLGYPRARLDMLYMVGGAISFGVMRLAGLGIDRLGAARVAAVGTAVFATVLYAGFIRPAPAGAGLVLPIFVLFMAAMSTRNVSLTSLTTRVPRPHERAGYMSLQSTAQHLSSAAGAVLSARLLRADQGLAGPLAGIDTVAALALGLGLTLPPLLAVIDRRVRERERASERDAAAPAATPSSPAQLVVLDTNKIEEAQRPP